jgi:hypothetical protein
VVCGALRRTCDLYLCDDMYRVCAQVYLECLAVSAELMKKIRKKVIPTTDADLLSETFAKHNSELSEIQTHVLNMSLHVDGYGPCRRNDKLCFTKAATRKTDTIKQVQEEVERLSKNMKLIETIISKCW